MFASNFEGKSMSVPLANLFLLNGVEDEAENARRAAEVAGGRSPSASHGPPRCSLTFRPRAHGTHMLCACVVHNVCI